jgi:hypothetical protein
LSAGVCPSTEPKHTLHGWGIHDWLQTLSQ